MNVELPLSLRAMIESRVLEKYPVAALTEAAMGVSGRYRREGAKAHDFQIASEVEALSYLAARMPATYAANRMVMAAIAVSYPDFAPQSVLDIGAGPGTSTLAAHHAFDAIDRSQLVEPNAHLRKAGIDLVSPAFTNARWDAAKAEDFHPDGTFDLVIASYVLNEIAPQKLGPFIEKLWNACSGVMMILEPGTPQGAGIIDIIRNGAIARHINILAPCPHANECPLAGIETRWCHFSVRTSRSKLHKTLKGGEAGFEDEKFSYIVLSRHKTTPPYYRLIGHPSGTKLREMQVCSPKGAETLQVSKSHPLHKLSKKLEWGDGFDI